MSILRALNSYSRWWLLRVVALSELQSLSYGPRNISSQDYWLKILDLAHLILEGRGFFFLFWLFHVPCGILVPQPGTESTPLAVEAWNPNHCTTRELREQVSYVVFPPCAILEKWYCTYWMKVQQKTYTIGYILNTEK